LTKLFKELLLDLHREVVAAGVEIKVVKPIMLGAEAGFCIFDHDCTGCDHKHTTDQQALFNWYPSHPNKPAPPKTKICTRWQANC
jgi:hypothetical protein